MKSPTALVRHVLQDQLPSERPSLRDTLRATAKALLLVRHFATATFRASQALGEIWSPFGYLLKQVNHVITGADLAWQAQVGRGLVLHHPTGVVWGPGVRIGEHCRIQQGVTLGGRGGNSLDGSPHLGDHVHLGAGSRVLGPISVGSGVTVGANAVVVRDVPSGRTVVGIPARAIPVET